MEDRVKRLNGRVCIVTGASSGIGRAIARRFCEEGAVVVNADVTEAVVEGGEPIAEVLQREGHECVFMRTDVSAAADVDHVVTETVARYGRLDVLVNNAVIRGGHPLVETSEEEWDRVIAVGLKGVFLMSKRAVQQMLTQEVRNEARGRIVNISSQHGMVAAPEDVAYGTAKSGVVYLTRQIAADYGKDWIICNAVAPGKILTGKGGRAVEPRWIDYSERRTPLPRLGMPLDVAHAALFLASDEARYMTGINLMVDGGWMAA
jgi:NAD(P)-dependent dehydrogenase (short-subunit alcohol dehydrogenase family)